MIPLPIRPHLQLILEPIQPIRQRLCPNPFGVRPSLAIQPTREFIHFHRHEPTPPGVFLEIRVKLVEALHEGFNTTGMLRVKGHEVKEEACVNLMHGFGQ